MGANHVRALARLEQTDLVAVCDIDKETAETVASEAAEIGGAKPSIYDDYEAMLRETKPEIVGIATPNRFHCQMVLQAVEAGAKAIYCEKPIAVDLAESRKMTEACSKAGVRLVVNHQRRTGADFVWLREQIETGVIGDVYLIRGTCAGDMLSDGTHLVDSALYLSNDRDWEWVFASYHRPAAEESGEAGSSGTTGGGYDKTAGWRFGHPVEEGMFSVVELEGGLRVELLTGDLRVPGRPYHDLEVLGTKGGLWRSGDKQGENLFRRSANGSWEPVTVANGKSGGDLIQDAYELTVSMVAKGEPDSSHPMGSPYAARGFELLMGAYESARTRTVIRRPVEQEKYPLAVELGLE